jgi:cation transporter-like permease
VLGDRWNDAAAFVLIALLIYLCLSLFVVPVGLALMAAASRADDAPEAPPADRAEIPPHATSEREAA